MSLVVPRGRDELIEFYRTHLPVWQQDPSRIGLSAGSSTSLPSSFRKRTSGRRR